MNDLTEKDEVLKRLRKGDVDEWDLIDQNTELFHLYQKHCFELVADGYLRNDTDLISLSDKGLAFIKKGGYSYQEKENLIEHKQRVTNRIWRNIALLILASFAILSYFTFTLHRENKELKVRVDSLLRN